MFLNKIALHAIFVRERAALQLIPFRELRILCTKCIFYFYEGIFIEIKNFASKLETKYIRGSTLLKKFITSSLNARNVCPTYPATKSLVRKVDSRMHFIYSFLGTTLNR